MKGTVEMRNAVPLNLQNNHQTDKREKRIKKKKSRKKTKTETQRMLGH